MGAKLTIPALLVTLMLASGPPAYTQEGAEGAYTIERTESGSRFIQRLTWPWNEYVYRYEAVIEKSDGIGNYKEVLRESTENNYITVSLEPGQYRYQISVYNLLDKFEYAMDRIDFTVYEAFEPELSGFYPAMFFLDEDTRWVLTVSGRNLFAESELYLKNGERIILPERYLPEAVGERARLVFNERLLIPGVYSLHIKNPGGLEAAATDFTIAYRKPFDLNLSLGYAPLFPAMGFLFDLFDDTVYPLGAYGQLSFVPFKRSWGFLGIEAAADWVYLEKSGDDYKAKAHLTDARLSMVYQKYLPNRIMAFNFRLGGGLSSVLGLYFEYPERTTESKNSLVPSANGGLSFMWFIRKPFFMEIGANYIQVFSPDRPLPGFIRPFAGAGRQF
ncbi:MAG: hypothetical protein LBI90_02065 [Treponema sp.]|jgi:hypothetical protein|nr:hypothetical protein [Treponema sp.]